MMNYFQPLPSPINEGTKKEVYMKNRFLKAAFAGLVLLGSGFANAGLIAFDYAGPGQNNVDTAIATEISFEVLDNYLIQDLNVFIGIDGICCVGNVDIWLEHLGQTVQLFVSQGVFPDADGDMQAIFDDEALGLPNSPNLIGTFQSVELLSVFDDISLKGTWKLIIQDSTIWPNEGDDLISWSLTGTATTVPEPSTLAIFALGIMGLTSRRFKK